MHKSCLTDGSSDGILSQVNHVEEIDEYRTWIIENNLGVVVVDQKN